MAACLILLIDSVPERRAALGHGDALTLATLAGAALITTAMSRGVSERVTTFNGMFVADPMGDVLKLFLYLVVGVALLYARELSRKARLFRGRVLRAVAPRNARHHGDHLGQ